MRDNTDMYGQDMDPDAPNEMTDEERARRQAQVDEEMERSRGGYARGTGGLDAALEASTRPSFASTDRILSPPLDASIVQPDYKKVISDDPRDKPSFAKGSAGDPEYDANPRDYMANRDKGQWQSNLVDYLVRTKGLDATTANRMAGEESSGVETAARSQQNIGMDPAVFIEQAKRRLDARIGNTPRGGATQGETQIFTRSDTGAAQPRGASVYTGSNAPAASNNSAMLDYLKQRDATVAANQASMRSILMEQLGQATAPFNINSDAMRRQLDPQRVALQRSAERQRSQMSARLAQEGLLDSGTFDTGLRGIEQQRGEAEASMTGQVVGRELQSRREQVQNLLQMAMQSGDAESARVLAGQLQSINMQLQQEESLAGQQLTREQNLAGNNLNYQQLMNQLAMAQLPYQRINLGTRQY